MLKFKFVPRSPSLSSTSSLLVCLETVLDAGLEELPPSASVVTPPSSSASVLKFSRLDSSAESMVRTCAKIKSLLEWGKSFVFEKYFLTCLLRL